MNKYMIAFVVLLMAAIGGCTKEQVYYTITSGITPGGTIDPLGSTKVEAGSSMVFKIRPDDTYNIKSIKLDGVNVTISNTIEIKDVGSNHEILVEFAKNTFTITTSADGGVLLDPKGVFTIMSGDSMMFSYSVDSGRQIRYMQVNGNLVASYPNKLYKQLDENHILLKATESDVFLHIQTISNDSLNIMSGSWYLQEDWLLELRDSTWLEMAPSDKSFKAKMVFSEFGGSFAGPDGGSATYFDENDKIFGGPYDWSIEGKKLDIANLTYTIVYLDSKKLVLDIILNDGAYISRRTYTHTPKKL